MNSGKTFKIVGFIILLLIAVIAIVAIVHFASSQTNNDPDDPDDPGSGSESDDPSDSCNGLVGSDALGKYVIFAVKPHWGYKDTDLDYKTVTSAYIWCDDKKDDNEQFDNSKVILVKLYEGQTVSDAVGDVTQLTPVTYDFIKKMYDTTCETLVLVGMNDQVRSTLDKQGLDIDKDVVSKSTQCA